MTVTIAAAEITRKRRVRCVVCGRVGEGYAVAFYLGDLEVKAEVCEECFCEKVKSRVTLLNL